MQKGSVTNMTLSFQYSTNDQEANLLLSSSYYKKILAKQHEMNDAEGDTTEYIHDPRCTLDMASKMKT